MLAWASLFEFFHFGRLNRAVVSNILRRARSLGSETYTTHPHNFVRARHGDHAFGRTDAEFLEYTEDIERDAPPL
jgi:hypothetical protein